MIRFKGSGKMNEDFTQLDIKQNASSVVSQCVITWTLVLVKETSVSVHSDDHTKNQQNSL